MFCTSLRKRAEWAPVLPILMQSQTPKWREKTLETHDIALPLYRGESQDEYLRLLLLSSCDLQNRANGIERIERLYHLDGGRHVGIIFLLKEKGSKDDGMRSYMDLQSKIMMLRFDIPILPLHSAVSLQATLCTYQRQRLRAQAMTPPINPAITILPFCTINPPMPEHTKNVLSDIFHNVKELSMAATTSDGQMIIKQYVDKPERQDEVIEFWKEEYTLD